MTGYTKLAASILDSTIWREDDKTRLLWITMLAMAGREGIVEASVPGLADRARISIPETEAALLVLSSPDRYSRTKDHDGRRIKAVDGGWFILNHAKYRLLLSKQERKEYQKEWVAQKRLSTPKVDRCRQSTKSTQAEAEAKADPFVERPTNHPPIEKVVEHFQKASGGEFRRAEIEHAFRTLEASKDTDGNWYWGKRMVGDWRAAVEARIHDQRKQTPNGKGLPTTAAEASSKRMSEVERVANAALAYDPSKSL